MGCDTFLFEVVKLLAQVIGALIVARVAVLWAISRYKAEKKWDYGQGIFVEAVSNIDDLILVVGIWIDRELEFGEFSEDYRLELNERYKGALRRLDILRAKAEILESSDLAVALKSMKRDIQKHRKLDNLLDDLETEYKILTDNLHKVIDIAKKSLE